MMSAYAACTYGMLLERENECRPRPRVLDCDTPFIRKNTPRFSTCIRQIRSKLMDTKPIQSLRANQEECHLAKSHGAREMQ